MMIHLLLFVQETIKEKLMKILLGLLLLFSINANATLETQSRCYIDTSNQITASGIGTLSIVASANRGCLFVSNKSSSLKVYLNPIASTSATDGIEIGTNTTFQPVIVPTNGFYIDTTGGNAAVTIESGYYIQ